MLKALWFLIRLSALVAAIVWLARNPGTVEIAWRGYIVDTSVGFVLGALAVLLLVYTYAYKIWRAFAGAPDVWRRYRTARRRELGYRDVTAGLVAVAAGDAAAAGKYAKRAALALPSAPLARLLTAQSYLLGGNIPRARLAFAELLDDSDAAFFGVKGLLLETLQAGDVAGALEHIRKADGLQPNRAWIARTLFDLETRNREWKKAAIALKKCEKLKVFNADEARAHRQALLLAEAEYAQEKTARGLADKAFSINPAFPPAGVMLAKSYIDGGKMRAALKVIEKAWTASPHPDLAALWMSQAPAPKKGRSPYDEGREVFDWAKRLYDLAPQHRDSLRMTGAAALTARQWREARTWLVQASDYRALAKLEREETGDEGKARAWLEAAADAPAEPKWVCSGCGHAAQSWRALCVHCGAFNLSTWAVPEVHARDVMMLDKALPQGDVFSLPR